METEIKKLDEMLEQGLITQDEYQLLRAKIIDKIVNSNEQTPSSPTHISNKVKAQKRLNYMSFGVYSLIFGAIIHLSSSFFGSVHGILYLDYLKTGTWEGNWSLYSLIEFVYGVSFFGYIFYYLGYLMLLFLFEKKFKPTIVVLLGISFFLQATWEITSNTGITESIRAFFLILIHIVHFLISTCFIKLIKTSKIDFDLKRTSTLILYAFSIEILLIFVSNFDTYLISDNVVSSVFFTVINFGYLVSNLLFLIFGIWLVKHRKTSIVQSLQNI